MAAKKPAAKKPAAKPKPDLSDLTRLFGVVRRLYYEMADGDVYEMPVTGRVLLAAGKGRKNEPPIEGLARLLKARWQIDGDPRGKLTMEEVTDLFVAADMEMVEPPTEPGEEETDGDRMLDPPGGGDAP